jgi:ATP-dependent protease Clp ATPase subunit
VRPPERKEIKGKSKMSVDFATFTKVAPHVTAVKKPVLLRGRHGIGKSCVVYQTAAGLNLPVVERRASQMTEGDLVGVNALDSIHQTGSTKLVMSQWFSSWMKLTVQPSRFDKASSN